MQGRKLFEDERELLFSLSAHVPAHNFYRRLKTRLDLAHRGMLVAAAAYNLQKLIRYTTNRSQAAVMALPRPEPRVLLRLIF